MSLRIAGTRRGWLLTAFVVVSLTLLTACSSTEGPDRAAASSTADTTGTSTVPSSNSSGADANPGSENPDGENPANGGTSDPHCTPSGQCPRQLTPTSWAGYHIATPALLVNLGGTQLLTVESNGIAQYWDLEDSTWGFRSQSGADLNPNNVAFLADNTIVTNDVIDESNPAVVTFKVDSPGPAEPQRRFGPASNTSFQVQGTRMITSRGGIQVWDITDPGIDSGTPTYELTELDDSVIDRSTVLTSDGTVYAVTNENRIWKWAPPAAPEMVVEDTRLRLVGLVGVDDGRLILMFPEHDDWNMASYDPGTGEFVEYSGYDSSARRPVNRVASLPDGRLVSHGTSDSELVFWDPAQPATPTVVALADDQSIDKMLVLDDGRVLVSSSIADGRNVETPLRYYSMFDLITPPS